MAWQDVQGFYDEQDDLPDPPEVELTEATCAHCGRLFPTPADEQKTSRSWACEDAATARAQDPTPPDAWDEIPF